MKVLKFGGTSVGTPERMHHVADLITEDTTSKIVVLSAVSGTTNALVEIGESIKKAQSDVAKNQIEELNQQYLLFNRQLFSSNQGLSEGESIIASHFNQIRELTSGTYSDQFNKVLLSQGELLSTKLFHTYLKEKGIKAALISALDFMQIDENGEPLMEEIAVHLNRLLNEHKSTPITITQGFICRNPHGEVDNLKRGGSDYSASLIGAALKAEEVQIWTDIDGMHNNDPRIVDKTYPIARLSFDEAAELAYFGAKILHPSSIWPAQKFNVPVRLLNTMQPEALGTLISEHHDEGATKAIAAKDGITAIKIKSSRMLLAYGFLRKIFEIFEKYKTSIDMITTSEVAVSLTIDDNTHLSAITAELKKLGTVSIDEGQSIVCIVGDLVVTRKGIVKKVFNAIEGIPVRMISYGGSRHNISILIESSYKKEALNSLNKWLF